MVVSMTGFGRGEVNKNGREITVEVRSLNNRFLDVSVRIPKNLLIFEEDVKNYVRNYLIRGRVNVIINVKESNGAKELLQSINLDSVKVYWNLLRNLKKELHLSGKIGLEHLLTFQDKFLFETEEEVSEEAWSDIQEALKQALENLKQMRFKEGKELSDDLIKRIKILEEKIKAVENRSKTRVDKELMRIRERITLLGSLETVDEGRLEMEITLLASRMDVTEECIRFKSHNKLFLEILSSQGTIGRKLNFLLQEMTREANTIGAKAYDAEISHLVVEIKEEVEKIREQVQNIE